jgi:site-specific recombinase XerD
VLQGAETGDSLTKTQFTFAKGSQMRDVAILTLLLNTGIRVSEMVGIDLQDIDWNEKRIKIFRKGRKEQYVYFNAPVEEALQDYIDYERKTSSEDLNALFISRKGQRISVRAVERLVKKYTASVVPMKRITPHKLRSTFATNLYEETGDIYVTSEALGHSSLETVKKYTNLHDERRRRAAEAIEKAYYRGTDTQE